MLHTENHLGQKLFSGNTFNPTRKTPIGIVKWEDLPARERKGAVHFSRAFERVEGAEWVAYRTWGKAVHHLPRAVFEATTYESNEAMIDAYAAKRAS